MKVKVKSIEIDFNDDVCDSNYQNDVIQSVLDSEWIVDDEEEIVDMISDDDWMVYLQD